MRVLGGSMRALALLALVGFALAPSGVAYAAPTGPADFDADGVSDVAINAYWATVNTVPYAGAIGAVYGQAGVLSLDRWQRMDRSATWIPDDPTVYGLFGADMAAGDFDADGFSDLAVFGGGQRQLVLAFGSETGLRRAFAVTTPVSALRDTALGVDAGDFNNDGASDVVVVGGSGGDHAWVLYGEPDLSPVHTPFVRLRAAPADQGLGQSWEQSSTTGDINGDSYADLVLRYVIYQNEGHPYPRLAVYLGGANGLALEPVWTREEAQMENVRGPLAIGDLDGDGYGDLVVGYDDRGPNLSGEVDIRYGSMTGPSGRAQVIHQNSPGVPGTAESGDGFGYAVGVGDVNHDGHPDLAIGVVAEDVGAVKDAGMVTVILGKTGGPNLAAAKGFTQNTAGVPGTAETPDLFGSSILLRDLTGDARAELVAGSENENTGEGLVHVLKGSIGGISTSGALAFGPRRFGIRPAKAHFGWTFG